MTEMTTMPVSEESKAGLAARVTGRKRRLGRRDEAGVGRRSRSRIPLPGSHQDRLAHGRVHTRATADVIIVRGHRASS